MSSSVKIFAPNVIDITLVDLPGIPKLDILENQAKDVRDLLLVGMTILLATQGSPRGLPHSGPSIGEKFPAGTGIGMKNLPQLIWEPGNEDGATNTPTTGEGTKSGDIRMNRSVKDALAYEVEFFLSHPVYSCLRDRCGLTELEKKLNRAESS
ncbi:Dynamin-related protein 3B [Glycine max]|nr:Dynamin-related protein 3B [Glycine max]KAH1190434.1 Dynamin-related protein 3B [Glycine max]KAH1190435.1 Dynamin-related protein 3B [Glycine max]